jgi:hypothetical protein
MSNLATDKQVGFITSLMAERDFADPVDFDTLTVKEASALIDRLMALGKSRNAKPLVGAGMYQTADGTIYKVRLSKTNGNPYALRLDPDSRSFEYEQGAIRSLSADNRLTVEQAKAFGAEHGICCVCGADLTDPTSVARGIGPICEGRL